MTIAEKPTPTGSARKRYESFPYPERDPADDRDRLCVTGLDDLGVVNFYCYRGKRNFRDRFRVLVAGGGTGDALIYLTQQLIQTNAEIVYFDLSRPAMETAQARARCRGFEHRIEWRCGDLLDLSYMDLEPFDYINCCSVLHHLDDPSAGIRALKSVLTDDGAVGLKVYARYGRTGIEQLQALMRLINRDETDEQTMIDNTRSVIEALPPTNWYKMGAANGSSQESSNDTEIFHTFVAPTDHSFTVPQLYELLKAVDLHLVQFTPRQRVFYTPGTVNGSPRLQRAIANLSTKDQQAAAELLYGTIKHHSFWATARENTIVDLSDPDNVPFFSHFGSVHGIRDSILGTNEGEWSMKVDLSNGCQAVLRLQPVPALKSFLTLINDHRTMGEIVETIVNEYDPSPTADEVWRVCLHAVHILLQYDLILFRHGSVPSISLS